jgi:hypothetical protein
MFHYIYLGKKDKKNLDISIESNNFWQCMACAWCCKRMKCSRALVFPIAMQALERGRDVLQNCISHFFSHYSLRTLFSPCKIYRQCLNLETQKTLIFFTENSIEKQRPGIDNSFINRYYDCLTFLWWKMLKLPSNCHFIFFLLMNF